MLIWLLILYIEYCFNSSETTEAVKLDVLCSSVYVAHISTIVASKLQEFAYFYTPRALYVSVRIGFSSDV